MNEQRISPQDKMLLPLRKLKIQWRLIILYAVICVVPTLLFGTVYRVRYTQELENTTGQSAVQLLSMMSDRQNDFLDNLSNISMDISTLEAVQNLLGTKNLSTYEKNTISKEIQGQIERKLVLSPMVKSVMLTDIHGELQYSMGYETIQSGALDEILTQVTDSYSLEYITGLPQTNTNETNMVWIRTVNRTNFVGQRIGYLILLLDEKQFSKETYQPLYQEEQGEIVLLSEDGTIVSSCDSAFQVGLKEEYSLIQKIQDAAEATTPHFKVTLDGTHYYATYHHNARANWYALSLIRNSYITAELKDVNRFVFMISTICILLGLLGLTIISASIVRPVSRLVQYCDDVSCRSGPRTIYDCGNDELGYLTRQISNMVQTIDDYNAKEIQNSIAQKNLEIQMLQAQINPHFLFNTLNTIKWVAVLSRVPTVADSLSALSGLLKNTIVTKGDVLLLKDELENVRNYARLQSLRYAEQFAMKYDIEPGCNDKYILKFLLQPIVENAIIYGVEGVDHVVTIEVKAQNYENGMMITIHDDGAGFDVKILQNREKKEKQLSGIGIENVRQRIQLAYGQGAQMIVDSETGKGTTVKLILPGEVASNDV